MKILFYARENGEQPVLEFLESLDHKMSYKIHGAIKILAMRGHQLHEPYSKKLDDHIFELRVRLGSDIARILYFHTENNEACLTNGFIKKQDRTPRREIEKANRYREEWYQRKELS